jgi:hypothetical protein
VFGVLAVLAASPLAACVKSKGISSEDKSKLAEYILDAPPADMKRLDVNFENKVTLLGYKIETPEAKPGTDAKFTLYWKANEKLEDGWLLFTHITDPVSQKSDNVDWGSPIREMRGTKQALGPDRWEPGKVYADAQSYRVQQWVEGSELIVYTGVWKGDARLRVLSGAQDGDNRAIALKLSVSGAGAAASAADPTGRKPTDIPTLLAVKLKAGEKVVVDGNGDDKAWATAASTGAFVDVMTGRPVADSPLQGQAKVLWDDENVYFLIDVREPNVIGGFDPSKKTDALFTAGGQPKLWTRHTAEIMIDPEGDGDNADYYELQINPQNFVFKSHFESYNLPKKEPNGPFGHEDWDPKLKSAVVVRGTLDKEDDKDDGYTVEVAIPWAGFHRVAQKPPKAGDTWRVNFYAMQNNGGHAWSPILGQGNFHKATRFGRITWMTEATLAATATGEGHGAGGHATLHGSAAAGSGAPAASGPAGNTVAPSASAMLRNAERAGKQGLRAATKDVP